MPPVSFANVNPQNFELTPCRVTFKGVDLGATKGNVKVSITTKLSDLKADQLGDTIIDKRVSGFAAKIETMLDETQLKSNWKVVFPQHKLYTDPVTGKQSFYFDSQVGASMVSLAGPLTLHPLSRPNTDLSGDVMLYLATSEANSDYVLSPSEQNTLKIVWDVYPDFTTQPPRFLLFGDPSVGFFNAIAGAATAGTGNSGGEVVGSITVFNAGTKTETISLTCQAPGTGGSFYVQGSVSGPLGLATIGETFNSNEISFVISASGAAPETNDSFMIATTASNFI